MSQMKGEGQLVLVLFQAKYVNYVEVWKGHTVISDV